MAREENQEVAVASTILDESAAKRRKKNRKLIQEPGSLTGQQAEDSMSSSGLGCGVGRRREMRMQRMLARFGGQHGQRRRCIF